MARTFLVLIAAVLGCSDGSSNEDLADASGSDATMCVSDDSECSAGCSWVQDCPVCGPEGMLTPMLRCSLERPCTNLLPVYTDPRVTDPPLSEINVGSFAPSRCETDERGLELGHTAHDDGPPIAWTDVDGGTRYHCEYRPPSVSVASKRPLLVFVHGSGGNADSIYGRTSLRDKAPAFDLTGDSDRLGFIVIAPQARNLHWPTIEPQDGSKHDTFYRDLLSPSNNRDIAYYDHLIDSAVAEGIVDPDRIYISGWSNGARFAALYGIARHTTTTPGGSRIAAVVNYSGGDPFSNGHHGMEPSCQQGVYPTSAIPLLLVSRTCDIVACNEAQDQAFLVAGTETSPGNIASAWIRTLRVEIESPNVTWSPISAAGAAVAEGTCAPANLCSPLRAALNHVKWPDGIADESGIDHESTMLAFMRANPLN